MVEQKKSRTLAPEHCPHVAEAADTAVKKVFAILGVDVDVPKEVEQFREISALVPACAGRLTKVCWQSSAPLRLPV